MAVCPSEIADKILAREAWQAEPAGSWVPGQGDSSRLMSEKEIFYRLVQEWKSSRGFSSSSVDLINNKAYVNIRNLGTKAIPWIIDEFVRDPDHWDYLLEELTGVNPEYEEEIQGDLEAIAQKWVKIATELGHISYVSRQV